jgi:hypothetical protein
MNASNKSRGGWRSRLLDYTPLANLEKGPREWWLTPPRSGIYLVIAPWIYRHPRFFGSMAVSVSVVPLVAGFICLSYDVYGWAAFFLALAALALGGGAWYLSIANSASTRT